jgi:DNA-binding response OmpR family regulator
MRRVQPRTVLVVEDDPDVLELVRTVLEEAGLAVRTTTDGWQALELAGRCPPAALVLDLHLSRLDAADVVHGLRVLGQRGVPLIVMSGDRCLAARAAELGAVAYLRKPFDVTELVTRVRQALANPSSAAPRG